MAYYGVTSHHCPLIDGGSSDGGSSEGHSHDGLLGSNNFEIPRVTPGWRQRPVDREGNDCRGRHWGGDSLIGRCGKLGDWSFFICSSIPLYPCQNHLLFQKHLATIKWHPAWNHLRILNQTKRYFHLDLLFLQATTFSGQDSILVDRVDQGVTCLICWTVRAPRCYGSNAEKLEGKRKPHIYHVYIYDIIYSSLYVIYTFRVDMQQNTISEKVFGPPTMLIYLQHRISGGTNGTWMSKGIWRIQTPSHAKMMGCKMLI